MEKIKELTRVLLVLFLATFSFPILAQGTSQMETSPIPESNWMKLTNHLAGADSPAWSPDGNEIVYNTWDETPLATVYTMKADGSNPTSLGISEVQYPHVSPDGSRIVTTGFGYVWVCNYDGSDHHHIYGVYDHGVGCPGACHHYPKWSPKGDKIVVPEQTSYSPHYSHIITINTDGTNPTSLTDSDQAYQFPFWSPDGTKIAYQKTDHSAYKSDIWIMDADGGNKMRITYFEDAMLPVWSPDGARIFFIRLGSDWSSWSQRHIYCMNSDGTNVVQLTNSGGEWSPAVSPDGKWLAFAAYDENGIRNIYKTELPSDLGTWIQKAPMPTPRRDMAAVALNKKIYVIGGINVSGGDFLWCSIVEIYDPVTDTWTTGRPMPDSKGGSGNPAGIGATVIDNRIYVVGGDNRTFCYDPETDQWDDTLAEIPINGYIGSAFGLAVVDGKIYVAYGGFGITPSWTYSYNPSTDAWNTTLTPIPDDRSIQSFAQVDGKLYAIGGHVPSETLYTTRVDIYDPETDSWELDATPRMSYRRTDLEPTTPVIDDKIYVIGGWDSYRALSEVEVYDPSTNTWTVLAPMPTPRWSLATAVVSGRIYAIGGNQYRYNLQSANEEFTPQPVPPVEDTEAYIEYVNGTIQDLPEEVFNRPGEDVPDVKNDSSNLFNDALQNINEGNYELAIEKLNRLKTMICEEIVECKEREEIISLIDDLIAYLETL